MARLLTVVANFLCTVCSNMSVFLVAKALNCPHVSSLAFSLSSISHCIGYHFVALISGLGGKSLLLVK